MSKLATEYSGFLKFIKRANNEIISWFGPSCNYDATKIAFMAAREWEGMADNERRYFIKANKVDLQQGKNRSPSGSHPFLCYLLHKRHSNFSGSSRVVSNGIVKQSLFHPEYGRANGLDWRAMPKTERQKYANMKVAELSIDHIIEKREKLHEIYDQKELSILEFILKTKPKKSHSSRTWFFTIEGLRVNSTEAKERWCNLSSEDRRFYDHCMYLDKKRFQFEKNAWITNLLSIDFERDDLTLKDFESMRAKSNVETIGSLIEQNKSLIPSNDRPRRPLGPFSLFVRDFRYQIRANKPEFRFGQHLKETSEAWARLSDDERQFYKNISKELRDSFNQAKETYMSSKAATEKEKEVSALIFQHQKAITGPSKPSHLVIRVPNVVDLYGKAMNLKKQDRKKSWESLSEADREPFIQEHKALRVVSDTKRAQIKAKLQYIYELIRKSDELERFKKQLHLLRARNRPVKDIYE